MGGAFVLVVVSDRIETGDDESLQEEAQRRPGS